MRTLFQAIAGVASEVGGTVTAVVVTMTAVREAVGVEIVTVVTTTAVAVTTERVVVVLTVIIIVVATIIETVGGVTTGTVVAEVEPTRATGTGIR